MISAEDARRMLLAIVDGYLTGSVNGRTLVKSVDDLVGNDVVADFPPRLRELTDALQCDLALYVSEAQTRLDSDAYFGDEALSEKVKTFRERIALGDGES